MRPELSMMTKTKWIAVALILGSLGFSRMGIKAMNTESTNSGYMVSYQDKNNGNKTAMYFGFTTGIVLAVAGVMVWRIE